MNAAAPKKSPKAMTTASSSDTTAYFPRRRRATRRSVKMHRVRSAQYVLRWMEVVEASSTWMRHRYPRTRRALLRADPTPSQYLQIVQDVRDADRRYGRSKRHRRMIDGHYAFQSPRRIRAGLWRQA